MKDFMGEMEKLLIRKIENNMKKPKLGSGARFSSLSGSVAQEYIAKGKSPEVAKKIGAAVAANAGRAAHGAKEMQIMALKARLKKKK